MIGFVNNSNRNLHQADDRTITEEKKFHFDLNYFDNFYSRYSASILLQNKGNITRDHLDTIK